MTPVQDSKTKKKHVKFTWNNITKVALILKSLQHKVTHQFFTGKLPLATSDN